MRLIANVAAAAVVIASAYASAADRKPLPTPAPTPAATAQAAAQPALNAREVASLGATLREAGTGSVLVACGGPWCQDLAEGVARLFAGAGWTVSRVDHGGIGIDGVAGIRVNYCGVQGQKVRDALSRATSRHVETVEDSACSVLTDRDIRVIIGTPGR